MILSTRRIIIVVSIYVYYKMSSQRVYEYGTGVRTGGLINCTANSGGTQLSGVTLYSVSIVNLSGNAPVWIGGIGSNAPTSGTGLVVYPGFGVDFKIDNLSKISVCAEASGNRISWAGVVR
jgi:hypothetical protein